MKWIDFEEKKPGNFSNFPTWSIFSRILQVNLADLNSDEDQASKKIRLCIEVRVVLIWMAN